MISAQVLTRTWPLGLLKLPARYIKFVHVHVRVDPPTPPGPRAHRSLRVSYAQRRRPRVVTVMVSSGKSAAPWRRGKRRAPEVAGGHRNIDPSSCTYMEGAGHASNKTRASRRGDARMPAVAASRVSTLERSPARGHHAARSNVGRHVGAEPRARQTHSARRHRARLAGGACVSGRRPRRQRTRPGCRRRRLAAPAAASAWRWGSGRRRGARAPWWR